MLGFSVKAWLGSVLLGSLVTIIIISIGNARGMDDSWGVIWGFCVVVSGLCSLPALILFYAVNRYLGPRATSNTDFRIKSALLALTLSVLTFLAASQTNLLEPKEDLTVILAVAYSSTLVLGIFYFRAPESLIATERSKKTNGQLLDDDF